MVVFTISIGQLLLAGWSEQDGCAVGLRRQNGDYFPECGRTGGKSQSSTTLLLSPIATFTMRFFRLSTDRSCGHRHCAQQRCAHHIPSIFACDAGLRRFIGRPGVHVLAGPAAGSVRLVGYRNHSLRFLRFQFVGCRAKRFGVAEVSPLLHTKLTSQYWFEFQFKIHHIHRSLSDWRHRRTALPVLGATIRGRLDHLEHWAAEHLQFHFLLLLFSMDSDVAVHPIVPAIVFAHVCVAQEGLGQGHHRCQGKDQVDGNVLNTHRVYIFL